MANPIRNPDGTVQVAPPTQSAFAQPPGPPLAPPPAAQQPPAAAGAIQQLIATLVQAFAPKALTQAKARQSQSEATAEGATLGQQF